MKAEQIKSILRMFLLIQYVILIASFFIYAGALYEYKNVCPRGENLSLLTGGKIYLDQSKGNIDSFMNYEADITELNLENFLKGENQSGLSE